MAEKKDIKPEIHFHSDLMQFFKNKKVDFKAWGAAGPDLHKYAYLNCMKNYFPNDYNFGNFSPIVNISDLEEDVYIRDLFIIAFILKNQRLSSLCLENKNSIVYEKFLHNDYILKSRNCPETKYNIYNAYLEFSKTKNADILKSLENQIKNYFIDLKLSMLS